MNCESPYTATFAGQVTCSETCAKERRRKQRSLSSRRYRKRHAERYASLVERVRQLEAELHTAGSLQDRFRRTLEKVSELEKRLRERGERTVREAALKNRIRELEEAGEGRQQLEGRLQDALEKNRELLVEIAHLKARIAVMQAHGVVSRSEERSNNGTPEPTGKPMLVCRRMNLRATTLPCGQRDECRYPSPCEQMAKTDPGNRSCPQCQKEFKPSHHKQKYCSGTCADAARKDRVRKA